VVILGKNSSFSYLDIPINKNTNKRIGVLGGIGPESTGEFYNKLIKRLQERGLIQSNRDFPQIIINSIPAPEIIFDRIPDKDLESYLDGLKELDRFGVDFIIMVCNTIHLYYDRLQKEINTPILDLKQEVRITLKRNDIKSVLIIGTPNTIRQGLYRFDGIETFEPNDKEIRQLTDSIFNFNKGHEKEKQIQNVKSICQRYLDLGAETIVLGCTEFAVMLEKENLPTVNTIDILVESVLQIIKTKHKQC